MLAKISDFVKAYHSEIVLSIAIVCITIISFNLGRISVQGQAKLPLTITSASPGDSLSPATKSETQAIPRDPTVVASKAAGSKLYHFTWCSGAKRIAEKNKITFQNEAAAISAGYTLAGNCQK